ncbi:hypothetical protein LSAT2_028950 [Lamellibrachia satsuma]|nr:hypothetical protein LSAT2_028950 [Lamellibrachia satsuma]
MEGMHVDFELLTSWMVFKTVHDFKLYLARLRALPPRLERDLELLRRGVAVQKTMSAYSLKGVVKAINTLVNTPAAESVFYKPFIDASHDIAPDALKPIQEEAVVVIREQIAPAFMKLATFIDEVYMKACRPEAGISSMPGGQSFYLRCLQWHTSLTLSPQQVHDIGLEEVNSIRGEMQKVIEKVGFGGTFKEFIAVLKGNKKFYYDNKDALMEGFRHICYKEIRPILSKIFHKIPKSELMIAEIPASRAHGPTAFYVSGTLDGTRPGKFFVNTYNLHRKATYDMMTLSLHEGEPGHHFQGMYAIEMKDLPMFRRHQEYRNYWQVPSRFPQHMAYSEGWGLYSEYLGKELGLYEDPYSLFGHLSAKMFRACRLVADTGIHALGWTHEQAVALFLENTAMSEAVVKDEVTRYITWPGQACAYMMGLLEIQRLRQKAAEKLGDTFDVRDFHAEVLQCGRVPLQVLETVIDKYISRQQSCDH